MDANLAEAVLGVVQVLQLRTTQQLGSHAKNNDEARAPYRCYNHCEHLVNCTFAVRVLAQCRCAPIHMVLSNGSLIMDRGR
jgi:hypothetical protein